MPKRRTKVPDDVRELYIRAIGNLDNAGRTVEEISKIVREQLRILEWEEWGEHPPGIDWVYKLKRELFSGEAEEWKDKPWSIGELATNNALDPAALPDLLDVNAISTVMGLRITNRQAVWISRIRHAVVDDQEYEETRLGRLMELADKYASLERISELTQTPFDTTKLDDYMSLLGTESSESSLDHTNMKIDTYILAKRLGMMPVDLSFPGLRVTTDTESGTEVYGARSFPPRWFGSTKIHQRFELPHAEDRHPLELDIRERLLNHLNYEELPPAAWRFLYLSIKLLLENHPSWQLPRSMKLVSEDSSFSSDLLGWIEKKEDRIRHFSTVIEDGNWEGLYDESDFFSIKQINRQIADMRKKGSDEQPTIE